MENVLKELGMETEMRFKIKGKCALFFFQLKLNIDLTSTLPLSHISGQRLFSEGKKNSWDLVIPSLKAETEGLFKSSLGYKVGTLSPKY